MVARVVFDSTLSAQWWRELSDGQGLLRHHWCTRVSYYRALTQLIDSGGSQPLPWHVVVDHVIPNGSRTTFYELAGWQARRSLLGRFARAGTADSAQIAYRYHRPAAVDRLADEAKVWSYWRYRERLVSAYEGDVDPAGLAAALEEAVREWARHHRRLAAHLDHAPPMCAVEDLSLAWPGGLAASRAFDRLAASVAAAVTQPSLPVPVPVMLGHRFEHRVIRDRDAAPGRPSLAVPV